MRFLSNINPAFVWRIKHAEPLKECDELYIKNFNPAIYCNDLTGKLWAFDAKLPSGAWLENICFNNDLSGATAEVHYKEAKQ